MESLQSFIQSAPVALQAIITAMGGAIPFIEAEIAAGAATLGGVPVIIAVIAAILGNFAAIVLVVLFAEKIREWRYRKNPERIEAKSKMMTAIHKYGIPGASLLSPLITGTHLLAFAAASTGANRGYILAWQAIAITAWGIIGGVLVTVGAQILG